MPVHAQRLHAPGDDRAAGRPWDERGWYRLSAFELATGVVAGTVPPSATLPGAAAEMEGAGGARPPRPRWPWQPRASRATSAPGTPPATPRAVLEDLLLEALRRPPCVVAFSGGRDSSAVLALAVHVAREHGLPPPLPVTRRFPEVAAADETHWQERVARHLGLRDWVRLTLRGDDSDLVGPVAAPILRRHGLLWPPTAHLNVPVYDVARGGTVLTGDGGDEVFGPHRATPLLHALFGGAQRRRSGRRNLVWAIGPATSRRRYWRRHVEATVERDWLRPAVRAALIDELVAEHCAEPLSWRAATLQIPRDRAWVIGAATRQRIADGHGVQVRHPFLAPRFLEAFAASGPRLGPMTRAAAMRGLFADVLPADVLRRTSKAVFNRALVGAPSRAFAAGWRGRGVDPDLVDEERLRQEWLKPLPHASALPLLQAAWMAARGWPPHGHG